MKTSAECGPQWDLQLAHSTIKLGLSMYHGTRRLGRRRQLPAAGRDLAGAADLDETDGK